MKQAVILVGGRGSRLGELTQSTPKPLLPVGDRPFLDWLIGNIDRFGVRQIVLLAGHQAQELVHYSPRRKPNAELRCHVETEPQGTGGALLAARDALDAEFLLFNGDSIFSFNYLDLALRTPPECQVALSLRNVPDAGRYGTVRLDGDRVASFMEKRATGPGLVNGGVYLVRQSLIDSIRPGASLEKDVLPNLPPGTTRGFGYEGFFIDIGIQEDYRRAQIEVPAHFRRPAVFFDRDGTLNEDSGYVHKAADLKWLPGAREAIKLCNDLGYLVIVITNQAGVARGYYPESAVHAFHAAMNADLAALGAHIDAFYFCPHHPTEGDREYTRSCDCRKPAPGLLKEAQQEWNIDMGGSIGVGDKDTDALACLTAGVDTFCRNVDAISEEITRRGHLASAHS